LDCGIDVYTFWFEKFPKETAMNQATILDMDTQQDFQDWECICGYVNEGIDDSCLRCSSERDAATAELNRQREAELIAAQLAKLEEQRAAEDRAAAVQQAKSLQASRLLGLQFRGRPGDFLGQFLLISLLCLVTFGIYSAWGSARTLRWIADNSTLQGRRLAFTGKGLDILLLQLLQGLLISVTFGIYTPWAIANMVKWFNEHVEYAE
jgi:hypothetical protein